MVQAGIVQEGDQGLSLNASFGSRVDAVPAQLPRILRDEVLIVVKKSRYELDMEKTGLSKEELLAHYDSIGESGARVLAGHMHNLDAIRACKGQLPGDQVVQLDEFTSFQSLSRYKVIIALGGDDFFKLIGQHVEGETCILGMKSDSGSVGVLLPFNAEQIGEVLEALEQGHYRVEEWTRPRLSVDGKDYGTATNEIFLGKLDARLTSRHILEYRGETVTHRSSGLLASNGAGSTGWYSSAGLYLGKHTRSFARTAPELRFELREPYSQVVDKNGNCEVILPPHVEGRINQGEIIRITSLNNEHGIISRDSLDEIPFPRGSVAEISVEPNSLRVIVP